jgi:hypothetical protein
MTASKKVRHVVRFRILFLFLFLSLLQQGPGKGTPRKGSFNAKEANPEPTTDQGFVGWPPKGSTAASDAERGMTLGTFDT